MKELIEITRALEKTLDENNLTESFLSDDQVLDKEDKYLIQRTSENIDYLLSEFGAHMRASPHQIIRFLQKEIWMQTPNHTKFSNGTEFLVNALSKLFPEYDEGSKTKIFDLNDNHLQLIENTIRTAVFADDISNTIKKYYKFTRASTEEHKRYIDVDKNFSLKQDILLYSSLLNKLKRKRKISWHEYDKLRSLRFCILVDLSSESSMIRKSLGEYIVSLDTVIVECLKNASNRLSLMGFGQIWDKQFDIFYKQYPNNSGHDYDVLADEVLLIQIINNMLFNVHHSILANDLKCNNHVWLEIKMKDITLPEYIDEPNSYVELSVHTLGKIIPQDRLKSKHTTIADQAKRIASFGANLELFNKEDATGTVSQLTLISRRDISLKRNHKKEYKK